MMQSTRFRILFFLFSAILIAIGIIALIVLPAGSSILLSSMNSSVDPQSCNETGILNEVSIVSVSQQSGTGILHLAGRTDLPAGSAILYEIWPVDLFSRKKTTTEITGSAGRTTTSNQNGRTVWTFDIDVGSWRSGGYVVRVWPERSDPRFGDRQTFFLPLNETISNEAGSGSGIVIQSAENNESAYHQERISPAKRWDLLNSANEIPFLSQDREMDANCIRLDVQTLVAILLSDPNAQDMLMKGGNITGIGTALPRSGKTNPRNGQCTAAIEISSRNVTSEFVIDQDAGVVSRQVIETPSGTHASISGNQTVVSINDRVVFIFDNHIYFS